MSAQIKKGTTMRAMFIILSTLVSFHALADYDFLGYKLNGKLVQNESDARDFLKELDELRLDSDYEVEVDLCVIYGDERTQSVEENLGQILVEAGYSMELENIYGDAGNHVFEIYDVASNDYLGAISGIYGCN